MTILKIFSKNCRTAVCRTGNQFNFASLTQYFTHEFLLYSFARHFIRLLVRSFVRSFVFSIFSIHVYVFSHLATFHHQVGPISIQLVEVKNMYGKVYWYEIEEKLQNLSHIVTNFPLKIPTPPFENLPLPL